MRLRFHKSRTTTTVLVVSVLFGGGIAAGASSSVTSFIGNLNSPTVDSQQLDQSPGKSTDPHGKDCTDRSNKDGTTQNSDNPNWNSESKGNRQNADCPPSEGESRTIILSDQTVDLKNITRSTNITATTTNNTSPVTYALINAGSTGCSVSGNTVSYVSVGDCVVIATISGTDISDPATISVIDTRIDTRCDSNCGKNEDNGNNGNATVARVTPTPSSTPLPVSRVLIPQLTNLTTTYNGRSQGVSVLVEPRSANCRVTYNGSTARPSAAGTYNVVVLCRDGRVQGGTTGSFIINKAPTTLNWADPNPITTMDELSKVQLNAKANVPGTYNYEEKPGAKLPAGTHELNVSFTPRDERNYLPSATTAELDVVKYANKFAPIKVPFNLSSAGLTAKTRPVVSKLFLSEDVKQITVYGYVQPSNNKKADMKLSLARANTVAKQIRTISPDVKIVIKAMGATINSACKAYSNKCVIVK